MSSLSYMIGVHTSTAAAGMQGRHLEVQLQCKSIAAQLRQNDGA